MHTDIGIGAPEALEISPGVASLFSGVDRMVIKTEPDLVSYLNSTPPLPLPWQHFYACEACLFLVGHANLSLIRGPGFFGSLGCVSISKLMEAMCSQNGKNLAS